MNTLLVISDELLRRTLAEVIKKRGYYHVFVLPAATSEEALLSALDIELLMVSLNLEPGGAEPIVQAFRAKEPRLPVLLVAGSFSERDLERVEQMRSACWCTGDFHNFWPAMMRASKFAPTLGQSS